MANSCFFTFAFAIRIFGRIVDEFDENRIHNRFVSLDSIPNSDYPNSYDHKRKSNLNSRRYFNVRKSETELFDNSRAFSNFPVFICSFPQLFEIFFKYLLKDLLKKFCLLLINSLSEKTLYKLRYQFEESKKHLKI